MSDREKASEKQGSKAQESKAQAAEKEEAKAQVTAANAPAKAQGETVTQEPGQDKTNTQGATVKGAGKAGNVVTPDAGQLMPKTIVDGSQAKQADKLVLRGAAQDIEPIQDESQIEPIDLRSGEPRTPDDALPVVRAWQSEIPGNPNQIFLAEAPKPDVVTGQVAKE